MKVDEKKENKDVEMQVDKEEKVEDKEVPKEGMEIEVSAPSQDQEMRPNTDPENAKETEAVN